MNTIIIYYYRSTMCKLLCILRFMGTRDVLKVLKIARVMDKIKSTNFKTSRVTKN